MKRTSEKKYTTVQISKKVREVLRSLARAKRRSMTKQIEWLVLQEAQRQRVVSKISDEE